ARASAVLSSEASYLITGGLGDLGLIVAEWMVTKGARNLVLAGRRAVSDEGRRRLDAMAVQGVSIHVVGGDLGDPRVASSLVQAADRLGALRGIVHAAGALDDALLLRQDAATFATAMAGKARGAIALDDATHGHALDFFVLF